MFAHLHSLTKSAGVPYPDNPREPQQRRKTSRQVLDDVNQSHVGGREHIERKITAVGYRLYRDRVTYVRCTCVSHIKINEMKN